MRAAKPSRQTPTLLDGDHFIGVAMDDQRRNGDRLRVIEADVPQAIVVEPVGESYPADAADDVRNGAGRAPFSHTRLSILFPQHLRKVRDRTPERQAG